MAPTPADRPTESDVVHVDGPGLQCLVDANAADALGPWLKRGDPEAWPGLREVKASRVRRVLQAELAAAAGPLQVHLKLYRAVRLSDRARDALAGSRAAREFHNLREAQQRRLPCVAALAAGRFTGTFGARSFLLTRTEPGAPVPAGPLGPELGRRVGGLLRTAHDAGLHARDLHPGNLLQRPDGSVVLLDLTSAAFAQALELDERARALAFFCLAMDGGVRDPGARALVQAYEASPELVERAAQRGRRLRHRALSAFGRRATRACRHTKTETAPGGVRRFWHLPTQEWHERARSFLATPPTPAKSGRRGSVRLDEDLVCKERTAAAARRLFRAAYWLDYAGVPCAAPVALCTAMRRGQVVSRRVAGRTLAEEVREGGLSPAQRTRAARHLGEAVGRLHGHGLRNRDLKLDNLVRDPATDEVRMVDLDGIRRRAPDERRGQAADLGRLLAAFRAAGSPGGTATWIAFVRGYTRARRCLLRPIRLRDLLPPIEARASAWASAHATTPTP
ncbi:MAG: lipopolysaccharide kinase InaA family protein [Planctomycetota bacterium]